MKKRLKILAIIIGCLCLLAIIGRVFYKVLCISCTFPPMRTYQFQGSVDDLDSSLQKFAVLNPGITYKFSRRDSSVEQDDGNRDLDIELKKDTSTVSYGLVCEQDGNTTEVGIVSVFSQNNTYGGYGIKAPGVSNFLAYFEKDFLVRLRNQEHVSILPK